MSINDSKFDADQTRLDSFNLSFQDHVDDFCAWDLFVSLHELLFLAINILSVCCKGGIIATFTSFEAIRTWSEIYNMLYFQQQKIRRFINCTNLLHLNLLFKYLWRQMRSYFRYQPFLSNMMRNKLWIGCDQQLNHFFYCNV